MTDFKTIMYSMTPSTSGSFIYDTSSNAFDSIQFNNGANWSDRTSALVPTSTTTVNLVSLGGVNYGAVGAVWYFGKNEKFDTMCFQFSGNTSSNPTRTMTYEYWNGSSWITMPTSTSSATVSVAVLQGALNFSNNTFYCFKINPARTYDWATTTVNGSTSQYFIRLTIGVAAFTTANIQTVSASNNVTKIGEERFTSVLTTTDDSTFTDVTIQAHSIVVPAFTYTANTTGARMYLGSDIDTIMGINFTPSTAGTIGTSVWEYWNGSAWTTINYDVYCSLATDPLNGENMRTNVLTTLAFKDHLSGWATTAVNGISKYWIRNRVTSNYTVSPIFQLICPYVPVSISRTVWIPESTNRIFQSAFIKLNMYNSHLNSIQRLYATGRFGSNSFEPLDCGEGYTPLGIFSSIGGRVFSTTANDGAFTDETTDASTSKNNDITVTNSVNANIYFCYPNEARWKNIQHIIAITSNGTFAGGAVAWEYWNGSAWTAFEVIPIDIDSNLNFSNTAQRRVIIPKFTDWTSTTVNSFTGYIIRRRITTTYSTSTTWTSIATSIPGINGSSYTSSGENNTSPVWIDATELFKSSFTGSSQTFDVRLSMANLGSTANFIGELPIVTGELYVTYGADEQDNRIKSVIIPLSPNDNTNLTTTLVSQGTNQLPDLATYLPEASKTIRNFYIVVSGNDTINTNITTEYRIKVGSSPAKYSFGYTSGGVSANSFRMMYVDNNISTGSTQDIQLALTSRHNSYSNFTMYAVVTYEYDAATTTRVINSLILPFETSSSYLPQDDEVYPEKIRKTFSIQEPGTINNTHVGIFVSLTDTNSPQLKIKDLSESSYKILVFSGASVSVGSYRYGYVLPTYTLARGDNTVGVDMLGEWNTSLPSCFRTCGYFVVNYHSDVASSGMENHNKTVCCLLHRQNGNSLRNYIFNPLSNPFTNWYINSIGFLGEFYTLTASSIAIGIENKFIYDNKSLSNPKVSLGVGGYVQEAAETTSFDYITSDNDMVKKYPGDLHDHRVVDLFDSNARFFVDNGILPTIGGLQTIAVCHEITYTINGTVAGYSGDGSGLEVYFYTQSKDLLFKVTTTIGGNFTATWYDNTKQIYCYVYDAGLDKSAESSPGIAGTDTFTLNLNTGTGGGTTSYAFIG